MTGNRQWTVSEEPRLSKGDDGSLAGIEEPPSKAGFLVPSPDTE
ncbi:hypothetical protein [Stieleria bergensis]